MADVALDAPNRAVILLRRPPTEGLFEAFDFYRIPEPRAGTMCLDDLKILDIDSVPIVHLTLEPRLRVLVRSRHPVRLAVMVDAPSFDDGPNSVTVVYRIR